MQTTESAGERVVALDLGCRPEAAVSGAMLIQSEGAAIVLFNAMTVERGADGYVTPLGTAIVELAGVQQTRFGLPNDEARPEHPLYSKGMGDLGYGICEVLESTWAREIGARAEETARRIHGARFDRAYPARDFIRRHFLFLFHDSTFECLARELRLTLSKETWSVIVERCVARVSAE